MNKKPGKPRRWIKKARVCQRFGGVDGKTIDAWEADPTMGFPKSIQVGRFRLFDEDELEAFEEANRRGSAA